ncbi:related to glu/asp-tRNA amidotransferase subunit A [Phialocephala subalpina]|uniref:Related to glu/asp-tRNA amidotransferase subunit A n=1 Tax=Phialocephala subalpina TaxID=576137 RepID=A0A1L7X7D6_9HELO|nr:related to glu/asp-tRNA amidotransferase subunit A [Phialocephala subalpina]
MKTTSLLLAILSFNILAIAATSFTSEPFDSREATIDSVHNALYSGISSCRDVVSSFISRIEAFNPTVNAIISLNPNALSIADRLDLQIALGNSTGLLFCIPVLLKDNFDMVGMNTTGGCLDLAGNKPTADAPVVTALKNAGAIILGKTNLHELALEGLSVSSLGGQTVNPYDHTRTPGGSSGGTGAAIGSSFAVFGTGTDTVNSLRSPASANSLFSVRPTRGLISRAGVIPISFTQDAIGPIARNVKDLAVALTVMTSVEYDTNDNTTALIPTSSVGVDYSNSIYGGSLKGLRLGLLQGFVNRTASNETTPVNDAMDHMVSVLEAAGATIVSINETVYNATTIATLDVQTSEYRQEMDAYLEMPSLSGTQPSTLNELYNSSKFLVIPSQYNYVNTALRSSTSNSSYAPTKLGIQNLTTVLRSTFSSNSLDAIIYPEQKNLVVKIGSPSQSGRNGILAALTGSPVVTIPAGFSPPTDDAPIGVPIGMEILGQPWSESKLLNIAAHISDLTHVRRMPSFANGSVEVSSYDTVPTITPNASNIPSAYPLGTL